jgi:hypothetical protein
MRICVALLAVGISTSAYAQNIGTTSGASSAINITNPADIRTRLITPPTVVAPGLAAAGIETCLGSSSGGLSLMGGGLTFGTTKVDDGCTIRLLARQLYAFGLQKAAVALMCQDGRVAAAMEVAGSACPASRGPMLERQVSAVYEDEASSRMRPLSRAEQAAFDRASN